MKKQRLYLVSLCAVLGLSLASCGDDNNDGGGCDPANASKVCGDPSVFYCDAVSKSCKRFLPEHCINKKTDSGSETDVDCGGACVSDAFHSDARNLDYRQRCNVGQTCKRSDDCKSGICEGNVCKVKGCETKADCNADETCDNNVCASCSDGMQNQGETDVDCGGLCASNATPSRCALGKKCKAATDCESGSCEGNVCVASSFEVADPAKLVINEIQVSSKSTPGFALNNDVKACEFVEIANSDPAKGFKLDGIKLIIERKDKEGALEEIDLTGNVIQPRSLVVVHNCETLPLPEKVVGVKSDILALVGSGTYLFKMTLGEKEGSSVSLKLSQYASSYNREIDFDGNANMNKTTAIGKNAAAATPGYCINGGLYHENCVTHCSNGQMDADESGVDCGGDLCEKCKDDGGCKNWSDCSSGYCYKDPDKGTTDEKGVYTEPEFGTCEMCEKSDQCKSGAECFMDPILDADGEPTGETINYCAVRESCKDKALNQDETDVDCGGICGSTCRVGQICGSGLDCMSTVCEDGFCAGTDPGITDVNALVINEVYDSSSTTKAGFYYNRNNKTCEFIEIANISDNNISLNGIKLIIKKRDGEGKSKDIELNGALDAKKILLVHSCKDGLDIPTSDARGMLESSLLATTSDYNIYLEDKDGNKSYAVDFYATEKDFTSSINRETDFDPTTPVVKTTELTGSTEIFATPGYCANGGLFSLGCQPYCHDTILNGNESDTDCGGNCQQLCDLGKKCVVGSDCVSGVCKGNICSRCTSDTQCETKCDLENGLCIKATSCTDKIQNGNETDVDCGGSCGVCELGKKCKAASDCETNECTGGVCTGEKLDTAPVDSLSINEIMSEPDTKSAFDPYQSGTQCDFIEIVNQDAKSYSLDGLRLNVIRQDKAGDGSVDLTGVIAANSAHVIFEKDCDIPELQDASHQFAAKNFLVGSPAEYLISISKKGEEPDEERPFQTCGKGNSCNRIHDGEGGEFSVHSEFSVYHHSPGYCANGGTFSSGCKVDCGNHGELCGGICSPCENGKQCSSGADCASGQCEGNVCTGDVVEVAKPGDIIINEVMAAEDTTTASTSFFTINGENVKECKFIEVVNTTSKAVKLDSCSAVLERTDSSGSGKQSVNKMTGILPAKGVMVIHNCKTELPLPEGTLTQALASTTNVTQTGTYEAYIECGGMVDMSITIGAAKKGTSMNLPSDLDTASTVMVKHSDVAGSVAVASPGYCVNGKLFKDNCK